MTIARHIAELVGWAAILVLLLVCALVVASRYMDRCGVPREQPDSFEPEDRVEAELARMLRGHQESDHAASVVNLRPAQVIQFPRHHRGGAA